MRRVVWVCALASVVACKKQTIGGGSQLDPPPNQGPGGGTGTSRDGGTGATGDPYVASETVVRRLSQAELDNTLQDLVGDDTRPAAQYLGEDEFRPYDNDYSVQQASQALIDSIEVMAAEVAESLVADPARRDAVVPCTPSEPGDADCFRRFIDSFGRRVFRRPLHPEEVEPYLELLAFATEANPYVDNNFYTAVSLAVQAMLMDPEFLYRVEVGTPTEVAGVRRLDGFEIATRMAYLLWGSTPDEALLADAASGKLDTPAGRREVAARMMEAERAKAQLHRFHGMWLGYRAIPGDPQLIQRFNRETTALIDKVVFEDRASYLRLFSSSETFVDDALADHYGLPRPEGGEGWVAYEDGSMRAGILSHGSVLAAFSKFSDTSPTQRGILVRTRLMCQEIPPPPPDVDVDQPPGGGEEAACKVDRYRAHVEVASCAACHNGMDPIGFGLENFDIAGRFREHDDGAPSCTIDGVGELPGLGTFSGPKELSERLAEEKLLERCAVRQYFWFSQGRKPKLSEREPIDALAEQFAASGHRFDQMIQEYVASEAFALKQEGSE